MDNEYDGIQLADGSLEQSQDFIDGRNDGYYIESHFPDMKAEIDIDTHSTPSYVMGFIQGVGEREQEREVEQVQSRLHELESVRSKDREKERDIER